MKKIITLLMLVSWMLLIFSFSRQNGEASGSLSESVGYRIARLQSNLLQQEKTREQLLKQAEGMDFIIRKGAHMSEYAILGILFLLHCFTYQNKRRHPYILALLFCIAFAATDEIHQLFVPGRSGQLADVCIDAAGGLLGITAAALWNAKRKVQSE